MFQIGDRVKIKINHYGQRVPWVPLLDKKTGTIVAIEEPASEPTLYDIEFDESFMIDRPDKIPGINYQPIPERMVEEKNWSFFADELEKI